MNCPLNETHETPPAPWRLRLNYQNASKHRIVYRLNSPRLGWFTIYNKSTERTPAHRSAPSSDRPIRTPLGIGYFNIQQTHGNNTCPAIITLLSLNCQNVTRYRKVYSMQQSNWKNTCPPRKCLLRLNYQSAIKRRIVHNVWPSNTNTTSHPPICLLRPNY